jgi:hypothetical protein
MQKIIAESECLYQPPGGVIRPVRIYVRAPYDLNEGGAWGCYCHIEGLLDKERRACGEGSMQALCLALVMLKIELRFHEARGGRFYHTGDPATPIKAEDMLGDRIAMPEFQE